ncbi:hypothetical protein DMI62_14055 [Escherichia coli]|nr:hypothetical protein [Escherichia coli]
MLAGLDEIFTAPTDVRAHVSGAISYYDWTGSTSKCQRQAPTALPLRTWRHLSDHAPLSAEIHL